ncbi:MAG TPA: hypothetical protein PK959_12980 [Candidatus Competibacteraceae bacterium]|nr:hypothetical protein [Candidatus Competibacteraceae bacterium]
MAFSAEQLAAMESAAASGQLRVQSGDKIIQFQSLDMLLKAIVMARSDVTATTTSPTNSGSFRHRTAIFDD